MPREHALKCAEFAAKDRLHRHSPFFCIHFCLFYLLFVCLVFRTSHSPPFTVFLHIYVCFCFLLYICTYFCLSCLFKFVFVVFRAVFFPNVCMLFNFCLFTKIALCLNHGIIYCCTKNSLFSSRILSEKRWDVYILYNVKCIHIHYISLYTVNYIHIM